LRSSFVGASLAVLEADRGGMAAKIAVAGARQLALALEHGP
jgi:hypothetical protein